MELTKERRAATGAFYTPKIRANKAVEWLCKELWDLREYIFYDPACGEGALLEALSPRTTKFGTTLEAEDVKICEEKWFIVEQLDFLSPEAEGFCEYLKSLSIRSGKPIVVFTNPPYFKLSKDQYPEIKEKYWSYDTVELFYSRLMQNLDPAWICGFNKVDLWAGASMHWFRERLSHWGKLEKMFITPSTSRPWLKGKFPIAFNMIASYQILHWREKTKRKPIDLRERS